MSLNSVYPNPNAETTRTLGEYLQIAVKALTVVAPKKHNLPILTGILVQAEPGSLTLSATNLECSLQIRIKARSLDCWSLVVPPTALDVSTIEGVDLVPDLKTSTLTASNATTSRKIKGWKADDFPTLKPLDAAPVACVPAADLKRAIGFVVEAVGKRDPVVHLAAADNRLTLLATDGYRIHRAVIDVPTGDSLKTAVPVDSLKKLARLIGKLDHVGIGIHDDKIAFTFDGDTGAAPVASEFVTQVAESRLHPAVETLLSSQLIWSIATQVGPLQQAIKRARLFAPSSDICELKIQRYRPIDGPLWISAYVSLAGRDPDLGDVSTELHTTWETCPGNQVLAFNGEHLLDAVGKVSKATSGGSIALRFTGPNIPFMIEATAGALHLSAVLAPLVDKPSHAVTYPSEEDKQTADLKQAENDYATWIRGALGLDGLVAYNERARRVAALNLRARWDQTNDPVVFYEGVLTNRPAYYFDAQTARKLAGKD